MIGVLESLARRAGRRSLLFGLALVAGAGACGGPPTDMGPTATAARCASGTVDGPRMVFDLSADQLVGGDGVLRGGRITDRSMNVTRVVPLAPGRYRLEAWASSMTDGAGLFLRVGDADIGVMAIEPGPGLPQSAEFDVATWGDQVIRLSAVGVGKTRDVTFTSLRLTQLAGPTPDERAAHLREAVKGSNIVLVSLDTLRADHLSSYGYHRHTSPRLDALAKSGVRFANAAAASHWTAPSHATLLTGLTPGQHRVETYPDVEKLGEGVETLAEVLAEAGFETAAFVGGSFVSRNLGMAQGFDAWREEHVRAETRFAEAAYWLSNRESNSPFFLFVHTFQIHSPYDPPAHWGRIYAPDFVEDPEVDLRNIDLVDEQARELTREQLHFIEALYDGEIHYTDHEFRKLLEPLAEIEDRTLIVVTSDHGEEFLEHGRLSHSQLFGEVVRVPLILHHGALEGAAVPVVSQPVAAVDVVPTVLDLVGIAPPSGLLGSSVVPAMAGDCDPEAVAFSRSKPGGALWTSALDETGHFLEADGVRYLFRQPDDRDERRNIAGEEPKVTAAYRAGIEAWTAQELPMSEGERAEPPSVEQLKALGYLGY
ncbi:MAG: sulfatase [Deltaproteobacteria bacterium]|nr:sulfatase [Deltaproteobacteria bacterium]